MISILFKVKVATSTATTLNQCFVIILLFFKKRRFLKWKKKLITTAVVCVCLFFFVGFFCYYRVIVRPDSLDWSGSKIQSLEVGLETENNLQRYSLM